MTAATATDRQADGPRRAPLALVGSGAARPAPSPRPGPAKRATADGDAIRELWRIHGSALKRFALKLTLGDTQRAEDIVQETMLRAWRHPEVVGGGQQPIRPWLFTVTRRVAIDMWRARSRTEEVLDDRQADIADPVESIEQAVTALDMRAALAQLTPEHRQVVVEIYYLGRSVSEIARTQGIPEGTVKSRTYYGLRQLKRLLSAEAAQPADLPGAQVLRAASA